MDEREQIRMLLFRKEFWSDQRRMSDETNSGISIRIIGDDGSLSWVVTWPDKTESCSDHRFNDWIDVRVDLRAFLTRRLSSLS
jgi:hypothetical protein